MSEQPTEAAPRRRPTRWITLGVVAVLWLGAAAAVIVATRRDDDTPAAGEFAPSTHDPAELRGAIGDLPEGYQHLLAIGADVAIAPPPPDDAVWMASAFYGTPDDPSAPRALIAAGDEALAPDFDSLGLTTGIVESEVDGRRAACGNWAAGAEVEAAPEQVWCYVDAEQQMVRVQTERIGLEATIEMLQGVEFDGEEPRLAAAVLPDGMELLAAIGPDGAPEYARSLVQYEGPCTTRIRLSTGWADEHDIGMTPLSAPEWQVVDVNGATGYLSAGSPTMHTLVWEDDDRSFELTATTSGDVDLVEMARSVTTVSTDEWAALNVLEPVPVLPRPSTSASPRTVDALQATEEQGDGGTVQMQSALGDSGIAVVEWEDDHAIVTAADGERLWSCSVPRTVRMEATGGTVVDGVLRAHGVVVVANGHGPRYLDVTSTDGTVVHTELAPLPGSTGGYIAIVELPVGLVSAAEVTDTLGKVLLTL
ncbi:MAG: hypothetical protein RL238_2196 [Actinomycetota bacterium]|jgi:hypothetical protein